VGGVWGGGGGCRGGGGGGVSAVTQGTDNLIVALGTLILFLPGRMVAREEGNHK
jgi:hypothetical protein